VIENYKAEMEDRKIQRMSPADKKKHQETVRNEGILVAQ